MDKTTIDKVYKTVGKLYVTGGSISLYVTSGDWFAPMIDLENKIIGIVNLKDLKDTGYWEIMEVAPREKYELIKIVFNEEFTIE